MGASPPPRRRERLGNLSLMQMLIPSVVTQLRVGIVLGIENPGLLPVTGLFETSIRLYIRSWATFLSSRDHDLQFFQSQLSSASSPLRRSRFCASRARRLTR